MNDNLLKAREALQTHQKVVAFSGAGLSAESGISTFRDSKDSDALWSRFDPVRLASQEGFAANPSQVTDWYSWRRRTLASVSANAAHRALATRTDIQQITQNVDNLLEQAGCIPSNVQHLHGSLLHDRCNNPACDYSETVDLANPPGLRECPICKHYLRPDVVWFGEALPEDIWEQATAMCQDCDCLLVVGTSATVYPAAGLITLAGESGAQIVILDPEPVSMPAFPTVVVRGKAGDLLPQLL